MPVRGLRATSKDVVDDKGCGVLNQAVEETGLVTGKVTIRRGPAIAVIIRIWEGRGTASTMERECGDVDVRCGIKGPSEDGVAVVADGNVGGCEGGSASVTEEFGEGEEAMGSEARKDEGLGGSDWDVRDAEIGLTSDGEGGVVGHGDLDARGIVVDRRCHVGGNEMVGAAGVNDKCVGPVGVEWWGGVR